MTNLDILATHSGNTYTDELLYNGPLKSGQTLLAWNGMTSIYLPLLKLLQALPPYPD